jgi:hypothetical protein
MLSFQPLKYATLAMLLSVAQLFGANGASAASTYGTVPPGGSYKNCHGYMLHVSTANIRVHCIDGVPKDLSFVSFPKFVDLKNGKTVQTVDLKPNTPVHVIFTESLGIRHAYKIYVADPNGHGLYGFKS